VQDEPDAAQTEEPPERTRPWRRVVMVVLAGALLYASFFVNIPIFFEYLPGPVRDVESLIHVTGAPTYASQGHLYLTTVYIDVNVTLAEVVASLFRSDATIVLRQQATGGQSIPQLLKQNQQMMAASKMQAEAAVLSELGLGTPTGDGVEVQATAPGSPSEDLLQKGDVVVAVDGAKVGTTCAAGKLIQARGPGDTIALTVERDGSEKQVRIRIGSNPDDPGAPFLGVFWRDVHYHFDPKVQAKFATGRIAGPSAGLLFALALYDKLTPNDLTAGRKIAGTGTIQCDGAVGPIGGIEEKVSAAQAQGAEIFLAPRSETDDARKVAHDIKVVAVSNFDEAVAYLENLAS
jgi:Lon-like protease